jgi:hypothetical protein
MLKQGTKDPESGEGKQLSFIVANGSDTALRNPEGLNISPYVCLLSPINPCIVINNTLELWVYLEKS